MIKIENCEVFGWEAAVRGMRNPKNSWDKSDSYFDGKNILGQELASSGELSKGYYLGSRDLELMQTLANAGNDHGKFLRMIHVSVDVTAPLYWWKEADQYKVGTTTDSCSTMHKIAAKEFELDDFSHEHLTGHSTDILNLLIGDLNVYRNVYLETKNKDEWWQLIQLLPSSYNQKRTWDLNYAVLKNIYHARKNHKLDEWHDLCTWIESLPFAQELIVGTDDDK